MIYKWHGGLATGAKVWYDGYMRQPAVLLDEFTGAEMKYTELLPLLDYGTHRVSIKGASIWWEPRIVFITSMYYPSDWYALQADKQALVRRVDHVFELRRRADGEYVRWQRPRLVDGEWKWVHPVGGKETRRDNVLGWVHDTLLAQPAVKQAVEAAGGAFKPAGTLVRPPPAVDEDFEMEDD